MEGLVTNPIDVTTSAVTPASDIPATDIPALADDPDAHRVLMVIERDAESVPALRSKLAQAGFKVTFADRGEDAVAAIDRDHPHLVMLDWDLPGMITMDLVRHTRRHSTSQVPRLIALSAFASEQHVVSGFELGIDDYVVKPFSVAEVVARVRALLRSLFKVRDDSEWVEFGRLRLDAAEGRASVMGRPVELRGMEFRLLEYLMRHPERAFSREQLLERV
jgi:two-component system phosphate regulon response regulator PhoB